MTPYPAGPACSSATATLTCPAGEVVVLRVDGVIDIATLPFARSALHRVLARRSPAVVVDLSGLTFCSIQGMALLVAAAGVPGFAVSAAPQWLQRQWALLWSDDELPVRHRTVEEAVCAALVPRTPRGGRPADRLRVQVYGDALHGLTRSGDPADGAGALATRLRAALAALGDGDRGDRPRQPCASVPAAVNTAES